MPVLGHVHGTELLMLERIAAGRAAELDPRRGLGRADLRLGGGLRADRRQQPEGLERAAAVLDLDPERFVCVPNGFDPSFAPRQIDRRAHWRRHLVERPQGWRPGAAPGSVAYEEADLEALEGTVLLYVGRFTEVKRLPLLIEAYARARPRFAGPAALVLLGGYPGEWEGEHPIETIERLGARRRLPRRLALPRGAARLPQRRRPARPRLGPASSSARSWSRRWPAGCR